MKIIIILGIIFLCVNTFRFVLGNYQVLKDKKQSIKIKVWNVIETVWMNATLAYLIWYWVKH